MDELKKLLENAGVSDEPRSSEIDKRIMEALELAHDTILRHDRVSDQTIRFTLDMLEITMKLIKNPGAAPFKRGKPSTSGPVDSDSDNIKQLIGQGR